MSQQIRVLRCIECKLFQVDIVKKSNKWQCKVCNQKQNVFKEFIRGSGQECRIKAQELNLTYGKQQERNEEKAVERNIKEHEKRLKAVNDGTKQTLSISSTKTVNKWNDFVDTPSKNMQHDNVFDPTPSCKDKQIISGSFVDDASKQSGKARKRQHSNEITMMTSNPKNKWNNFT